MKNIIQKNYNKNYVEETDLKVCELVRIRIRISVYQSSCKRVRLLAYTVKKMLFIF